MTAEIDKDWCINMAKREGDSEIGAGPLAAMSDAQIKVMVERFLTWRLPDDFQPDCGITFVPDFNVGTDYPRRHQPTGTNLLNYAQAVAMVRHMLEGISE